MVTSGVGVAASRFYDLAAPLLVRAVDRGPRLGDVHCCVQPRWYTRPPGMALTSLHKFDYELDWYQERARACLEDWGFIQHYRDGTFSLADSPELGWQKVERDSKGHHIIDLLTGFPNREESVLLEGDDRQFLS